MKPLLNELTKQDVMNLLTFVKKFHHYACNDRDLLPSVRRDFMKQSFLLSNKIEEYIDKTEGK